MQYNCFFYGMRQVERGKVEWKDPSLMRLTGICSIGREQSPAVQLKGRHVKEAALSYFDIVENHNQYPRCNSNKCSRSKVQHAVACLRWRSPESGKMDRTPTKRFSARTLPTSTPVPNTYSVKMSSLADLSYLPVLEVDILVIVARNSISLW